jgi:RNA polymerase sigma-70 factor (ECF subfamily)
LQTFGSDQNFFELLPHNAELAFEGLFKSYFEELCQVAYRVLKDEHQAQDLVQEVFFELWKKRDQVQISTSLRAYLKRAVLNRTLNYLRDRRLSISDEPLPEPPLPDPDVLKMLGAAELQQVIDRAIDQLPEKCRLVFVLSRFDELSYREIATQLNISEKTVENQVSKALKFLRIQLEPYLREGLLLLLLWFVS